MKFKGINVLIAIFATGIISETNARPAQASSNTYFQAYKGHHYTPQKWRGKYYSNDGNLLIIRAHSLDLNGKTLYKSTWNGWKKLSFSRLKNDSTISNKYKWYTFNPLAKYGYQSSRQWRLKYKDGHKELVNYVLMGSSIIWHKY